MTACEFDKPLQQRRRLRRFCGYSGDAGIDIGDVPAVLRDDVTHAFLGKFGVELYAPGVFAKAIGVVRVVVVGNERHCAGR